MRFGEDDIIFCTYDPVYGYILFEKEGEEKRVKIPLALADNKASENRNFHLCVILQSPSDEV